MKGGEQLEGSRGKCESSNAPPSIQPTLDFVSLDYSVSNRISTMADVEEPVETPEEVEAPAEEAEEEEEEFVAAGGATEIKLFGKWSFDDIEIRDISLEV